MIIKTGKYTCYFLNSDTEKTFDTLAEAKRAAEKYVGNNKAANIFGDDDFLYGPGDGTTSVMVRPEITFDEPK